MKRIILVLTMIMSVGVLRANHWNPNAGQFADYMTVTAVVQINGVEQQSTRLELGAFCGGEVRGSKYAQLAPNGRYLFRLPCWGNSGDTFSFRLYDADLDEELDYLVCETVLTYNTNGYGGLQSPYVLDFNGSNTQTYNLSITGYGNSAGGYYLITPPIDDVNPAEIEGMTTGDYDLYYFDEGQAEEWRNYEANPFNLESGKGYLYANKTDVTLTFTGTPYSGNGQVTLAKTAGAEFEGWNLVGNPFMQTATIDRDCYVINADGTEIIPSDTRTVSPMQGVFVIAESDNEEMTFVPQNNADQGAKIVLNISKDRAGIFDRAIVRFEGNGTLPKFMLNPNNTKVYILQDGKDYAVANVGRDDVQTVSTDLCFKARTNGSYTLSVDIVNLDLDYLHLIDNKTGADIDLLQTPGYTFEANVTDYAERFKLVYATTTGINEGNEPFAYYADGEIRLVEMCHGMSLQIVDMTGRVVRDCKDGVQTVSTAEMTPGVYVLRLEDGDNVKVQKIVIK